MLRCRVSVLFNEPKLLKSVWRVAETLRVPGVSVLFNEPKLLKSKRCGPGTLSQTGFSALQRAEIAEIEFGAVGVRHPPPRFQCSSTSRNC